MKPKCLKCGGLCDECRRCSCDSRALLMARSDLALLRELVNEASEIMQIVYAGNFPAGIESFLTRAALAGESTPAPHPELQGWQPIATAPKDGTTVMLWWRAKMGRDLVAYWAVGEWQEFRDGSSGWTGESFHASEPNYWTQRIGERPTHWMPLPASPAGADKEKP